MAAYRLLSERADIRQLLQRLGTEGQMPYLLPFVGCLTTTLRGHFHYEAILDAWPHFTTIILRPNQDRNQEISLVEYYVYSDNSQALQKLLNQDGVIQWSQPFLFKACRWSLVKVIQEVSSQHGGRAEVPTEAPLNIFTYPPIPKRKEIFEIPLPEGFRLGSLRPEHAAVVNSYWSYGGDKAIEAQIAHHLRHEQSCCVFNEKEEPVSWGMWHRDGSTGFGYTLPKYRRSGLQLLSCSQMFVFGTQVRTPLWGYIAQNAEGAQRSMYLARDWLGATQYKEPITFLRYSPNKLNKSQL